MSRTRIDWEKGNRNERLRDSQSSIQSEEPKKDGIPLRLHERFQAEKLKPLITDYVWSRKPPQKIWPIVQNLIRHSHIKIIAAEIRQDGTSWCQCEMQIHDNHEACIEFDNLPFLLEALAERHELKGRHWILYFWLQCPDSVLS
jgi:hypothetical protein